MKFNDDFHSNSSDARTSARHRSSLVTLCVAVLVAQLDTSVVNLAVRPIGTHFRADVAQLQWTVDSYNLVYAALLLTGGLLADLWGRRRIFILGSAVFAAASLICGLAPAMPVLIAGRALAGVGAALLLPSSLAMIRIVWPAERERARVLGIWAACNGLALAIGPTLGGLLIRHFGWRSIFFVVVPLAFAAAALAPLTLPESSDPHGRDFDGAGQLFGAASLAAFAVAAIELQHSRGIAVASAAVALVALGLFYLVERRRAVAALVPLDLFKVPPFAGAISATSGMTFGMYGLLFLLPMTWLATGRLTVFGAGVALIPMALTFVLVSPFSGALGDKLGIRFMTAGGVATIAAGLLTTGFGISSASLMPCEAGLVLAGLGMGLATGPLMGVAVGSVSSARSGTAAALINVARMAGATIGVAVLGTIFGAAGTSVSGLRSAMITAASIQLAAAAAAALTIGRPTHDPANDLRSLRSE